MTEMKILFHIPDAWNVVSMTNTLTLVSIFGNALWESLEDKNGLSLNSIYRFNAADIPASGYKDFRTFLDDIRRREMEEIVLETPVSDSSGH